MSLHPTSKCSFNSTYDWKSSNCFCGVDTTVYTRVRKLKAYVKPFQLTPRLRLLSVHWSEDGFSQAACIDGLDSQKARREKGKEKEGKLVKRTVLILEVNKESLVADMKSCSSAFPPMSHTGLINCSLIRTCHVQIMFLSLIIQKVYTKLMLDSGNTFMSFKMRKPKRFCIKVFLNIFSETMVFTEPVRGHGGIFFFYRITSQHICISS